MVVCKVIKYWKFRVNIRIYYKERNRQSVCDFTELWGKFQVTGSL